MAVPPSPATGTPPPAAPVPLLRWRVPTQVLVERTGGLELPMVRIPAGTSLMGSPEGEEGRNDTEGPVHRVRLGEYLMGRTPVTQAQWRAVARWEPGEGERWGKALTPNPPFSQTSESKASRKAPSARLPMPWWIARVPPPRQ